MIRQPELEQINRQMFGTLDTIFTVCTNRTRRPSRLPAKLGTTFRKVVAPN